MPRLSEPMREALRMAERYGGLENTFGPWKAIGSNAWFYNRTVVALIGWGLLRDDGYCAVITPAGREAIGRKEGEDHGR